MLGAQPPPPLPTSPFGWVPRTSRVLGGAGAELAHPVCPKTPGGAQGNALGELEEEHSVPLASSKPSHAPEVAHQKKKHHEFPNCPEKGQKCWVIKQRNHKRGPRAAAHPSRHTPSVAEPLPLRGHPPQHHHHPRWVLQSRSAGRDSSKGPRQPLSFFFWENIHVSDEQFGTQAPWPCFTRFPFQRLLAC